MSEVQVTRMTKSEAEAQGFTVDTHCYPWLAYKGARFAPTEKFEIEPEPENGKEISVISMPESEMTVTNPFDMAPAVFKQGLQIRKLNRDTLIEWIRSALVEGIDYGRIHIVAKSKCELANKGRAAECKEDHHWSKKILFQPGAQKICGMLGITPRFPSLKDYEKAAVEGTNIKNIILKCELTNAAGTIVAEGVGARSVEKEYGDLNKALKMSEKSGHIDATLKMGGLSELFTQDEDAILRGEDTERMAEEHHLVFYNMVKDSGLFDSEEKIQRQLSNLSRAVGKESITEIPLSMFDLCKIQLKKGLDALAAKRKEKSGDGGK